MLYDVDILQDLKRGNRIYGKMPYIYYATIKLSEQLATE